jgi:3-methyladenine DNA glycosylase AlkD
MDVDTERRYLLEQIEKNADPDFQEVMHRVIPTGLKMYGLRTPVIREMARTWQRDHKEAACEDLLAVVEAVWEGESREERMVALELLQHHPSCIPDLTWAHFERWRQGLDNWEITDVLGRAVLGPWVLGDPDARLAHLGDLIGDEDVWSRRLALVAAVGLNRTRKDVSFPALTLELIDQVKEERHPMITKAISWTLREMIRKHPDLVAAYLVANRDVLAPLVAREVSNKLKTGRKGGKVKKRDITC